MFKINFICPISEIFISILSFELYFFYHVLLSLTIIKFHTTIFTFHRCRAVLLFTDIIHEFIAHWTPFVFRPISYFPIFHSILSLIFYIVNSFTTIRTSRKCNIRNFWICNHVSITFVITSTFNPYFINHFYPFCFV